ncbi:MAG: MCE family protein [Streptosporangiales bacterium]|nr:MCE family protein [Streptosporangiales bacterium]
MRGLLVKVGALLLATLVLAGVLVVVFDNLQDQPQHTYRALFTNVTGLRAGDNVRAAGVVVGRVGSVTLQPDDQALVTFTAATDVSVTRATTLAVRYADLIGNRYLEVDQPQARAAAVAPGAVIPESRTQPALSLDALFNGFQPLFQGLQPAQVNQLSGELISVMQGEGGTINQLLTSIGSLTSSVADRDKLIGDVVKNLNAVLSTVSSHDRQLSSFITRLQQLVSGLAADRTTIGNSVTGIANVSGTLAGLLRGARPDLAGTVSAADRLATTLNSSRGQIYSDLQIIPREDQRIGRQGLYGSFFNFYLCSVTLRVTGPSGQPVNLPTVNSEAKRCQ